MLSRRHVIAILLAFGLAAGGPPAWIADAWIADAWIADAWAQAAKPQPLKPQPAAEALKPGLVPHYYRNLLFNHVDELMRTAESKPGEPGKPVPQIDAGSATGEMWESGMGQLWGVRFDGLIKLERGQYYFAVNSNDGVRIFLGGMKLLEDPDVHADRFSDPVAVEIAEAGWYPLTVWYFQKRNTTVLQFLWQPPGGSEFTTVPATVLAHRLK